MNGPPTESPGEQEPTLKQRWATVARDFRDNFFHVFAILIRIFFHAFLFVVWIALDRGAGYLVHISAEKDSHGVEHFSWHDVPAHVFRWVASLAILALAITPAISDLIEFLRTIKKLWSNEPK
jgi:hypothetical protein